MKALLITAFASFFALAVSAQTATTDNAGKIATGNKSIVNRPVKVAESTTPAVLSQPGGNATQVIQPADKKAPVDAVGKPVTTPAKAAPSGPSTPYGVASDKNAPAEKAAPKE